MMILFILLMTVIEVIVNDRDSCVGGGDGLG